MPKRLFYIRHSIRGLKPINTETENCLPYLNIVNNLSLYGHVLSLKQGRFIRKYGKPDFILASNDERTIATAIGIAKGSGQTEVWFKKGDDDEPFFDDDPIVTKESLALTKTNLNKSLTRIKQIKALALSALPCLKLADTTIVAENGRIKGLLKELNILAQYPYFSYLSKTKNELVPIYKQLEEAHDIYFRLNYPLPSTYLPNTERMLNTLLTILFGHNLSVVVGHDVGIAILAEYLGKTYSVPDHPAY